MQVEHVIVPKVVDKQGIPVISKATVMLSLQNETLEVFEERQGILLSNFLRDCPGSPYSIVKPYKG